MFFSEKVDNALLLNIVRKFEPRLFMQQILYFLNEFFSIFLLLYIEVVQKFLSKNAFHKENKVCINIQLQISSIQCFIISLYNLLGLPKAGHFFISEKSLFFKKIKSIYSL